MIVMKKRIILFIFLLVSFLLSCDDQVTDVLSKEVIEDNIRYYPLAVGDFWIYNITHSGAFISGNYNYLVKKEVLFTLQATYKYYYVKESSIVNDPSILSELDPYSSKSYERVDSAAGVVKRRGSNSSEHEWMNLMMNVGEFVEKGSDTGYWKREVKTELETEILGISTSVKTYYTQDAFQGYTHEFAKNIGLIKYSLNGEYDRYNLTLKGAKIGDKVIGDTTTIN
jgi:hypothetical protein